MLRLRWLLACLLMAALPLQGMAAVTLMLCGPAKMAAAHAVAVADHGHHPDHGHGVDAHPHAADHDPDQGSAPGPDMGHKCGLCAAGCHSAAISQTPRPLALTTLPRAEAAEPFSGFHSRATTVPDKPPRA